MGYCAAFFNFHLEDKKEAQVPDFKNYRSNTKKNRHFPSISLYISYFLLTFVP